MIGENGVENSSVLLAISCVLSGSYFSIEKIGYIIFLIDAINKFMNGDKLPVVD
ncbi:hypothetical protein BSF_39890 [Bacillus subtilis]|nr:hypothetical protein BSF_39890 [Bacillus subtilis]